MTATVDEPVMLRGPRMRVGVVFCALGRINRSALKFLILMLNRQLGFVTFELLPDGSENFSFLQSEKTVIWKQGRLESQSALLSYVHSIEATARHEMENRGTVFHAPREVVLISNARDADEFFLRTADVTWPDGGHSRLAVLMLGNWKRRMAPPSIMEFILTMLVSEALCRVSPAFAKQRLHFGTRGCLGDFCSDISEARYKALVGHVCSDCSAAVTRDGCQSVLPQVQRVLDRAWLGTVDDSQSPSAITTKLGFDLFSTRGATDSLPHRLRQGLEGKLVDVVLKIAVAILLAMILTKLSGAASA